MHTNKVDSPGCASLLLHAWILLCVVVGAAGWIGRLAL